MTDIGSRPAGQVEDGGQVNIHPIGDQLLPCSLRELANLSRAQVGGHGSRGWERPDKVGQPLHLPALLVHHDEWGYAIWRLGLEVRQLLREIRWCRRPEQDESTRTLAHRCQRAGHAGLLCWNDHELCCTTS